MSSREEEYKKIFIAETLQDYDNISKHIVALEHKPDDLKPIAEIFRMLHNLKANANAIGYPHIAAFTHKLENAFSAIRDKQIDFTEAIATTLFEGVDHLGELLKNLDKPEEAATHPQLVEKIAHILEGGTEKYLLKNPSKVYTAQKIALSELVSIEVKKLDDLMNLVGELIIDRDRILSLAKNDENEELSAIGSHLYRISNEIQQTVMNTRLVSIGTLFNKFPRIVRDIALAEEKKVILKIAGQDIKVDRNILQLITDSLLHLVRNAITHGIEKKEIRKSSKKSITGELRLTATSDKDTIIITVEDDGQGIDDKAIKKLALARGVISREKAERLTLQEAYMLIFHPGFSLTDQVTEFSGRGVGLDIVKSALDSIGGNIKVQSQIGKGTKFLLTLPTSIAVKAALLFQVNDGYFALPLLQIDAVLSVARANLHQIGNALVTNVKGENISLIYLNEFLFSDESVYLTNKHNLGRETLDVIVVVYNNRKIGLIVDRLLRQQEIVIKPLQKPVVNIEIYSGVTLLGTGDICLLLDVAALARHFTKDAIRNNNV